MSLQCCCGRFSPFTEIVVVNEIKHEPLGPEGNFCGPLYKHSIRDLEKEVVSLRQRLKEAQDEALTGRVAKNDLENRHADWIKTIRQNKDLIRENYDLRSDLDAARLAATKACDIASERNRHAQEAEEARERLLKTAEQALDKWHSWMERALVAEAELFRIKTCRP